jgi:hypothetical protein
MSTAATRGQQQGIETRVSFNFFHLMFFLLHLVSFFFFYFFFFSFAASFFLHFLAAARTGQGWQWLDGGGEHPAAASRLGGAGVLDGDEFGSFCSARAAAM